MSGESIGAHASAHPAATCSRAARSCTERLARIRCRRSRELHRGEQRHALDVVGHREASKPRSAASRQPSAAERRDVPGERGRVAGDVGDRPRAGGGDRPRPPGAPAPVRGGSSTTRSTGPASAAPASAASTSAATTSTPGRSPGCAGRAATPAGRRLDHRDPARRCARPARRRTARRRRRGPRPARPAAGRSSSSTAGDQGVRPRPGAPARTPSAGTRPLAAGGHARAPRRRPGAARPRAPGQHASRRRRPEATTSTASASGHAARGDRRSAWMAGWAIRHRSTGTTSCERCWSRPGRPAASTAYRTRVRQPSRPPGSALDAYAQRVDLGRRQPGQPGQLLAHDGGLPVPLRGRRRRAAGRSRRSRPAAAYGQGGVDPVRRRPRAPRPRRPAGSPCARSVISRDDPLARQRVPDEHHPAVAAPGHAVPAVRGRPDGQLDRVALDVVHRPVVDRLVDPAAGPRRRRSVSSCGRSPCRGPAGRGPAPGSGRGRAGPGPCPGWTAAATARW